MKAIKKLYITTLRAIRKARKDGLSLRKIEQRFDLVPSNGKSATLALQRLKKLEQQATTDYQKYLL